MYIFLTGRLLMLGGRKLSAARDSTYKLLQPGRSRKEFETAAGNAIENEQTLTISLPDSVSDLVPHGIGLARWNIS